MPATHTVSSHANLHEKHHVSQCLRGVRIAAPAVTRWLQRLFRLTRASADARVPILLGGSDRSVDLL